MNLGAKGTFVIALASMSFFASALSHGTVEGELLTVQFQDFPGDGIQITKDAPQLIDVESMSLVFDNESGNYEMFWRAYPDHPFYGSFRIATHLVNPTPDIAFATSFSADLMNFDLTEPQTLITWKGYHRLFLRWDESDSVAASGGSFPDVKCCFATGVVATGNRASPREHIGTPIFGTPSVGFDLDIQTTVRKATEFCDFDLDDDCDVLDIDQLMMTVAMRANTPVFDITKDGMVDNADRDLWLSEAGMVNGASGAFLTGDANLDGIVDATDLNTLALNWDSSNSKWSRGNFVGSQTNGQDLNEIGRNWHHSTPANLANVPEFGGLQHLLIGIAGLVIRARRILFSWQCSS